MMRRTTVQALTDLYNKEAEVIRDEELLSTAAATLGGSLRMATQRPLNLEEVTAASFAPVGLSPAGQKESEVLRSLRDLLLAKEEEEEEEEEALEEEATPQVDGKRAVGHRASSQVWLLHFNLLQHDSIG